MTIKLEIDGKDIPLKVWKFPAGEVGVKLLLLPDSCFGIPNITLYFVGNDDLFALAQLVDILKELKYPHYNLLIPYLPYARQDRICNSGESFALKVFADFINKLDFCSVKVKDVHSKVSHDLINKLIETPQQVCARSLPNFDVLLAPDKGAALKIKNMYQVKDNVLYAEKVRDVDGALTGITIANISSMTNKDVCVVDDICDGGATFIKLAEAIEQQCVVPKSLSLYVTHGIFSKGIDIIFEKYDNVYVHNLMCADNENLITII